MNEEERLKKSESLARFEQHMENAHAEVLALDRAHQKEIESKNHAKDPNIAFSTGQISKEEMDRLNTLKPPQAQAKPTAQPQALSVRDQFAIGALASMGAMLASPEFRAAEAYRLADAMLIERSR